MLNVLYSCIAHKHDFRLVLLAAVVCVLGCVTATNLLLRARAAAGGRRTALLAGAGAVFGTGVWATHFVAELAFKPGFPISFTTVPTALSLGIAIVLAYLGFELAVRLDRPAVGGAIVGVAVGAMHFTGMLALRTPADVHWDPALVAISILLGIIGAAIALRPLWRGPQWRYRLAAGGLLVVAICGLHFTAMAAITLVPDPRVMIPHDVMVPETLAVPVAVATIIIVLFGSWTSILDEQAAETATHEADKLRRSEHHLAMAQRIARVGSIDIDTRTRRVEWSQEACNIFGIDRQAVEPTLDYFLSFVCEAYRRDVATAIETAVTTGRATSATEYRIARPDGEERLIYTETEIGRDAADEAVVRIIVFRDVTALRAAEARQKELERQLLHSQKLEALGTLAGGVAHDLNNTMMPVLALAKMVRDELPEASPLQEQVAVIIAASERARDLVKQILAFSRKEGIRKVIVDPARIALETLQMLRATLPPNVTIIEQLSEHLAVLGDAGQLQQVIVNLTTNAAQAIGSDQGSVTISVGKATSLGQREGDRDQVEIRISDTGCGMRPEVANRIFEPFFTTKGVGEGTGLGLSVVHGIITAHDGTIDVASAAGKGSTFTISLPAAALDSLAA